MCRRKAQQNITLLVGQFGLKVGGRVWKKTDQRKVERTLEQGFKFLIG